MAGPFQGMDPYIEAQGNWRDFHHGVMGNIRNILGVDLPDDDYVQMEERIEFIDTEEWERASHPPDIPVAREGRDERGTRELACGRIEPILVELTKRHPEEIKLRWLEIRRVSNRETVTVIELLSSINKTGRGRELYIAKRNDLFGRGINLVEIDLLLNGEGMPMKPPSPDGIYQVVVARGSMLLRGEVYRWSLRDPIPSIPIPLPDPDPDVLIHLQDCVDRTYNLGRYHMTTRYDAPLSERFVMPREDREWCETILKGARPGGGS